MHQPPYGLPRPSHRARNVGPVAVVVTLPIATAIVVAAALLAGCGMLTSPAPTSLSIPEPSCGGARVVIPGALPCDALVRIAIDYVLQETPAQLDRGVVAVDVELQGCPRHEPAPALECGTEDFVQLVTLTFGPALPTGPIEPYLAVGVAPVSGRVLGVINPLIR